MRGFVKDASRIAARGLDSPVHDTEVFAGVLGERPAHLLFMSPPQFADVLPFQGADRKYAVAVPERIAPAPVNRPVAGLGDAGIRRQWISIFRHSKSP